MKRRLVAGMAIVLTVLVVACMISCGGGGSGSSDFSGLTKVLDLDERAEDIPLQAGETWSLAFSVNLNMERFGGPYTSFALDLEDNLPGLVFNKVPAAAGLAGAMPLGTETGYLTIYVGPVDASDPCTEGDGVVQYGPYDISFDKSDQPESVDPSTDAATQDTIDIINVGAFSVCVEIDSPFDANVTQDDATFTACTENIEDIAGTWEGDYSCGGNCPDSGEITLWITQAADTPGYANYNDDGGAFYMGNVCGYTFSFDGGTEYYDEHGIFTMDPSGLTATKTSYYSGTGCSGNCLDTLHRPVDD